jgi:DNA-directed RNA polymerase subunit beta'
VAELFEARRPKDAAEISKIDGVVDFGTASVRGKRCILVKDPVTGDEEEHLIPIGKHVIVFKGDFVKKGQQLTEGPWCRTKSSTSADRRSCRNTWSTKCRRFTACRV